MKKNNMNNGNVISADNILLNTKLNSREEAIDKLSDRLVTSGVVLDKEKFIEAIYDRENRGSTFVGDYLAIPHGLSNCVTRPTIAIAKSHEGFEWDENGNLVKLIIMFAISEDIEEESEILKKVASSLGDVDLVKGLLDLNTEKELIEIIYNHINN